MGSEPDFTAINAAALARCPGLLESWLPGGRLVGREYTCGSLAGGQGDSCKVNVDSGRWADFANQGQEGGDLVSLFAAIHGQEQGVAARELARQFGLGNGNGQQRPASKPKGIDWTPISPVPADAPPPGFNHFVHGPPSTVWTYKDAADQVLMYVARFDKPDGKEILPMTFCRDVSSRREWRWKNLPEPRPLYGLDKLAARLDAPVLVVEGEKTADAAQRLVSGAVCVTWPGGSQAVKKADWRPLAGRRVDIWPDKDEPGFKAALAIATALGGIAAEVSIIRPPEGAAEKWDLADGEAAGWSPQRVDEHIQAQKMSREAFAAAAGLEPGKCRGQAQEEPAEPLPELPPLPLDVFPHACRGIITAAAEAFNVPPEVPACSLLALVATCVGRARGIIVKSGWVEHGNLFLAIVGRSGTGKSPCANWFFRPLFQAEKGWAAEYDRAIRQHVDDLDAWKEQRRMAKRGEADDPGEHPEPPKRRQIYVDDATVEALADAIAGSPRGVLWRRDELAGLLLDMDKYSGKDGSTKTRLMSAYDSSAWKLSRVLKGTSFIPNACLSIFGTIQPVALAKLFTGHDAATGLLARFLFVHAVQEKPPLWTDAVMSSDHEAGIVALVEKLLALDLTDGKPGVIGMCSDAKREYVTWHDRLATEQWLGTAGDEDSLLAKMRGQALRLALLLHLMDAAAQGYNDVATVTAETMAAALKLADWFLAHQRRAWAIVAGRSAREAQPLEVRVAAAILGLEGEIKDGMLPTARIAEVVNASLGAGFTASPDKIGRMLSKMGFASRALADRTGRGAAISPESLTNLRLSYPHSVRSVESVQSPGGATFPGLDTSKSKCPKCPGGLAPKRTHSTLAKTSVQPGNPGGTWLADTSDTFNTSPEEKGKWSRPAEADPTPAPRAVNGDDVEVF